MAKTKSVWGVASASAVLLTMPAPSAAMETAIDPPDLETVSALAIEADAPATAASQALPAVAPPEQLPPAPAADRPAELIAEPGTAPPLSDRPEETPVAAAPDRPEPIATDQSPEGACAGTCTAAAVLSSPAPQLYGAALDAANPEPPLAPTPDSDPMAELSPEAWQALVDEPASENEPDSGAALAEAPAPPIGADIQEPAGYEPPLDAGSTEAAPAIAQHPPTPPPPHSPTPSLGQITSVSQLSDVQPSDWAFQALQSLVERYGVVAGFPDGTFRGDRPLSRYEFAAGLNAALDAITQQLAIATEESPNSEDLATLQRLSDEFAAELTALRGRVDSLEARTAVLEAQQFSTTAVLGGQVILGLAAAGGGDPPGTGEGNAVLTQLTQLQIGASFTGRDALRVGVVAGNFSDRGFANPDNLNTNMALLGYQTDTDNRVELDSLEYRFAVGDRLVFTVKPVGFSLSSVLSPNSLFSSTSEGAISRFAGYSPVLRIGSLDSGAGADFLVTNRLRLQIAYGARNADDSSGGIFSSDHRALGVQFLARPSDRLSTGIAYVNAFARDGRLDTFTGSNNADISGNINEPSTIHALSGTLQWEVVPDLVFGAWGGVMVTDSLPSNAVTLATTYLFSLGWLDPFGREGDLLGVLVGQPPRLEDGYLIERADEGTSMHYEAFYRFRLNDSLSLTPGFFIVTDPGHISENNDIFVATLRTTFRF